MAIPRVVDGAGRLYFPVRNFQNPGDSSEIARVGVGSDAVETVARFKPRDVQRSESGGRISIQAQPMSPEDDWAVGADGTIALVRAADYHIDVVHPDGRISHGPEVDHDRIRPRDAEKQAWLDDAAASGMTIRMSIGDGQQQLQISRGGQGGNRSINDLDWPDRMPSHDQCGHVDCGGQQCPGVRGGHDHGIGRGNAGVLGGNCLQHDRDDRA